MENNKPFEQVLSYLVFPSEDKTISVETDEIYNGAHKYRLQKCNGFNEGKTEYINQFQEIQFVQKNDDGTMIPGIQSEQLVLMLIDRTTKLNDRFPSEQNKKMIEGLKIFINACRERVEDRIKRGTMGQLKK